MNFYYLIIDFLAVILTYIIFLEKREEEKNSFSRLFCFSIRYSNGCGSCYGFYKQQPDE